MSFWQQLKQPFFALAPMDDVTDVVFRQMVTHVAAPDVLFTEFVSTDGLQSAGRTSTLERLRIEPNLRHPLVAQIWGNNPENYYKSACEIATMGFSGIDINLGCPDKSIVARGCCGGLIGQNDRVAELIAAVRTGAPNLPISVKTRLGLREIITEDWAGFLLTQNLAALTIHGRTVREMSKVPAHWDEIAKVAALRNKIAADTRIIGNGDVENRAQGLALIEKTGVDGIMIGRGIFHDIFAFSPTEGGTVSPETMINLLRHHVELYQQTNSQKSYQTLKKFFKIYINGWPGAADLRKQLMETKAPNEVEPILTDSQHQVE